MVNNDNFVNEILNIVKKNFVDASDNYENKGANNLTLIIYIDENKCGINIALDESKESLIMPESLRVYTIAELFDVINQEYTLNRVDFEAEQIGLSFIRTANSNGCHLNSSTISIYLKDNRDKGNLVAIKALIIQYYNYEIDKISSKPQFESESYSGIDDLSKEQLLALFSKLSLDELQTLISFLPSERIYMLTKMVSKNSGELLERK